jgi:hypothetical protein
MRSVSWNDTFHLLLSILFHFYYGFYGVICILIAPDEFTDSNRLNQNY